MLLSVLTGNREALWAELKAGAESGWDFSSRWLIGGPNPNLLSSIRTSKLVPVDLNAFLCQAEELMTNFYTSLGEQASRRGRKGVLVRLGSLPQPWQQIWKWGLGRNASTIEPAQYCPSSVGRARVQIESTLIFTPLFFLLGRPYRAYERTP